MRSLKYLLLLLVCSLSTGYVLATHIMGGSLTYQYISYNSGTLKYRYKVTLKMYRDCNGVSLPASSTLGVYLQNNAAPNDPKTLYGGSGINMPMISSSIIPLPGQTAGCNFASNVCVEEGIYEVNIDIPFNAGGYHLIAEDCCRNNAIVNLNNPGGQGQSYYAFIPPNYINNSSPVFVDAPVPYICVGDTASLLNTVTDPDGDILTYSFVKPYQGLGGGTPNPYTFPIATVNYASGYSETSPFGTNGYASINAANGLTRYMSPTQGFFVVAVEIKEYRNNQLIGKMRRDMQIVVVNCPANPPPAMTVNPDSGYVVTDYSVMAGSSLCFNVSASDPSGDSLYLIRTGDVFNSAIVNPPATMSNASGDGFVSSQFCWSTACNQAGTYLFFVKITDNGCPPKTINQVYTINVLPFGPSGISGSNSVCAGQTGVVYTVTAVTGISYNWSVSGGTIVSGQGTNSITVNWGTGAAGTVSITETNTNGCVSSPVTLNVSIKPLPTANAGADQTICAGSSVQIGSSSVAGTTYAWTPASNLSNSAISNPMASPTSSTTYIVTASGSNGCTKKDTILVTVNPLPTLSVSPSTAAICSGGSVTLTASGANSYSWSPSTGLNTTSGAIVIASPSSTTTYTVTGTNTTTGCTNTATKTVTVNPVPTVSVSPATATLCRGASVNLTASGANTYVWSPSTGLSSTTGVTVTATPTATTTYTVTGTTTGSGCTDTARITINVNPLPNVTISPATASICIGNSINLTAAGANAYVWSPSTGLNITTGSNVTASPTSTTTYSVTGTNTLTGCSKTVNRTVTVNPQPILSVTPSAPSVCAGASVSLTASGANTYSWSPSTGLSATSGATVTATPAATTTYSVIGTNTSTGCADTINVTVTIKALPTVNVNPSASTICAGQSVNLTGSGANTYSWSPSTGLSATTGTTVTATPTSTITYTVTGTNTTTGCSNTANSTITVNALPVITVNPSAPAICAGASVNLTASGANIYNWAPSGGLNTTSGANVTASPVSTTTYTVTGTNTTTSCSNMQNVTVTVNPLPVITVSPSNPVICNGDSVILTANGANTYTWSPSIGLNNTIGANVIAFPSSTSTYTVVGTITATGCSNSTTQTVTVNPLPVVNVTPSSDTICWGASVNLVAAGADTYAWSPSAGLSSTTGSNVTASPTTTTTYTVIGTLTSTGCSNDTTVSIFVDPLPVINVTPSSAAICYGDSVSLSASGANNYSWSPAAGLNTNNGANVIAFPADTTTYTVTGTDTNTGCVNDTIVTVVVNPLPVISINPSVATICYGDTVQLTATGADAYAWSPATGLSSTSSPVVNSYPSATTTYVVAGTITITGCRNDTTVTVNVNPLPIVTVSPASATICYGSSVNLNASGADAYSWSPSTGLSQTTGSSVVASPGSTTSYTVTGTNGTTSCVNDTTITVSVDPLPVITIDPATDTICVGQSITLNASGAHLYTWSPVAGLNAGNGNSVIATPGNTITYTITGTDTITGCVNDTSITIVVNPLPVLGIVPPAADICKGSSVSLTANGAMNYSWSPGVGLNDSTSATVIASPQDTITYTVFGVDTNGCTDTETITVNVKPLPVPDAGIDKVICFGGSINIGSPSIAGNTYAWSPGGSLNDSSFAMPLATPLSSTIYILVQTNTATSCANSDTVTVTVNPLPQANAGVDTWLCPGTSANLNGSGGVQYVWSPGATLNDSTISNPVASPFSPTTYVLTVTDANSCVNTDTVFVDVNPVVPVNAGSDRAICIGSSTQLGGSPTSTPTTTYLWIPNNTLDDSTAANPFATPQINTTYIVYASNDTCRGRDTVIVDVDPLPLVNAGNDVSICYGDSTMLNASGALNYNWQPSASLSDSAIFNPVANPLSSTTYIVTGTDTNMCTNKDTVIVTVNPLPLANAGQDGVICLNDSIKIGTAANISCSYSWSSNPSGFTSFVSDPVVSPGISTIYYLTVTDTLTGCKQFDTVSISVNPLPPAITGNDTTICDGVAVMIGANGIAGNAYAWNSNPAGFNSAVSNPTVTPGLTTTYYLTETIINTGCTRSDSITITVNPLPLVDAGTDTAICYGTSVQIGADSVAGHNYVWTAAPSGFTSGSSNPIVNPAVSTTYYLTETINATSCSAYDSVMITVNPLPAAITGNDTAICLGETIQIGSDSISGNSYQWSSSPAGFNSSLSDPMVSPIIQTTYYLTEIINATGCSNSDSISVSVNPLPTVNSGADTSICIGSSVQIGTDTSSLYSYSWSSLPVGFNASIGNPVVTPLVNTTYYLTQTNLTTGCTANDSILININQLPPAYTGNDTSICFGASVMIGGPAINGNTYFWSSNPAGFTFSDSDTLITPLQTTTYYLIETNTNTGCTNNDSILIAVNPLPVPFAGNDTAICEGSGMLIGMTSIAGHNYSWTSNPAGFISTSSNPFVNPNVSTIYNLTETIANTGCTADDSVRVNVNPLPNVNAGTDTAICLGNNAIIGSDSTNGHSYSWASNPGGYSSNLSENSVSPSQTSIYYLTETIITTGCSKLDSVIVVVNPLPLAFAGNDTALCQGVSMILGQSTVSGHTYNWNSLPAGFIDTVSAPAITPSITTTYYLTETIIATGCFSSDSVTVIVNPLPLPDAGTDTAICLGATAVIGTDSISGNTYSWSSNPASYSSGYAVNSVTPIISTVYYLTEIIVATACTATDSIIITVNTLPAAYTGNDTVICDGINVNIGSAAISGHEYTWTSNPSGNSDTTSSILVAPTVTTTYYLTELNIITGCMNNDSVTILVNPIPPAPMAGSNSPVCTGDTIYLTATASGSQYEWTGPNNYVSNDQNPAIPNVSSINEGDYVATQTINGCVSPGDTVTVIISVPAIVNAGSDQFICEGDSIVLLNGSISGGTSTGFWSGNGSGIFTPSDSVLAGSYLTGTSDSAGVLTLVLTSTNNNNCPVVSDTMLLTIGTIPLVNAGTDQISCANVPDAQFTGTITGGAGTGVWATVNGTGYFTDKDSALNVIYHPTGSDVANGSVTLVFSSTNACTVRTDTVKLTFVSPPQPDFEAMTAPFNMNETIDFQNNSQGASAYLWNFGYGNNMSDLATPQFIYPEVGSFTVTLIAIDDRSCRDTISKVIDINVLPLAVPTAFTPNGDGANDVLFVKGGPFKNLELRVYNEWGNLVFVSTSQDEGWDGRYRNEDQPTGTYTYTVVATDLKDLQYKLAGDVTLIR